MTGSLAMTRSGIIPAYAGSTADRPVAIDVRKDHPRIRGEHDLQKFPVANSGGSSPHTRGALQGSSAGVLSRIIIPAYAGSTRAPPPRGGRRGDHPRIRGEHRPTPTWSKSPYGSSPHTRGAPKKKPKTPAPKRIIPAYAGSTSAGRGKASKWSDHPRIRGEHETIRPSGSHDRGSSPHTRGAPSPGRRRRDA